MIWTRLKLYAGIAAGFIATLLAAIWRARHHKQQADRHRERADQAESQQRVRESVDRHRDETRQAQQERRKEEDARTDRSHLDNDW